MKTTIEAAKTVFNTQLNSYIEVGKRSVPERKSDLKHLKKRYCQGETELLKNCITTLGSLTFNALQTT